MAITVPAFLLKRLYVKGSLRNVDGGFQFELKNSLGSGYGTEVHPLVVDGEEIPGDSSYLTLDGEEVPFSAVSAERPLTLGMNKSSTVIVKGKRLEEGAHKIAFSFQAQGLGKLSFEVNDLVQ